MQSRRLPALLLSLLLLCSALGCGPFLRPLSDPTPAAASVESVGSSPTTWVPYNPAPTPQFTRMPAEYRSLGGVAAHSLTPTLAPTPHPSSLKATSATPTPPASAPIRGEPLPFSLEWRFDSGGHLTDQAVISLGGQPVYLVTSLDRTVSALSDTGKVLWRARMAGPAYALAVMDGERVAVGDDAGDVTLLNTQGRRLWRYGLGSRVTALRVWQSSLLSGGWDERLTLLDIAGTKPKVRWQAGVGGPISGIATLPDRALAATLSGQVRAFDRTGAEVGHFDVGVPITGLETISLKATGEAADGMLVLAGAQDGRLLVLDANGEGIRLKWEHLMGQGGPVWHVADLAGDPTPEIVVGTGGTAPTLTLLTAQGDQLWRVAIPSPSGSITTLDLDGDGSLEILAGLASGEVQAFDGQGGLRGSINAGLPVWGLEATSDGTLLVRADVAAWQARGVDGPAGSSWLVPPAMVRVPLRRLPPGWVGANELSTSGTKRDGANLVFLGDVALGRSMEAQLLRYGPAYPWEGLGPLLREADLAVANLECVLTTQSRPLAKRYVIRAHPRWGQVLDEAGIDLVTVANNHALDYGQAGLDEMLVTLRGLGIKTVGAGSSDDQVQPYRPALFTLNGIRVAVLGYAAARWNGSADVPATDRLAWAKPDVVRADVRAAGDRADIVVVLLHNGTEYAANPSPDQVSIAHAAVDAGADLVVGHHPHVTQTVESFRQALIVYSLGDAVFDIPRPAAMRGYLLRVRITREGIARAELWPFWIEDAIQPRLLDDGQGAPRFQVVYP